MAGRIGSTSWREAQRRGDCLYRKVLFAENIWNGKELEHYSSITGADSALDFICPSPVSFDPLHCIAARL
jgi:hypothetical protein